jgi:hypothetical protein
LFGINVANKNKQATAGPVLPQSFGSPSTEATSTPTVTTTAPTPTVSGSPALTSPPATGDTFGLPDLAGQDFQAARAKVRELKLGWRLVFEGTEADPIVRATDPKANTAVKSGDTIKILVKGAAPLATVPDVRTMPCADAASKIVDQGLYPDYPTGRVGVVLTQIPSSSDPQTLHWNDQVRISCG